MSRRLSLRIGAEKPGGGGWNGCLAKAVQRNGISHRNLGRPCTTAGRHPSSTHQTRTGIKTSVLRESFGLHLDADGPIDRQSKPGKEFEGFWSAQAPDAENGACCSKALGEVMLNVS